MSITESNVQKMSLDLLETKHAVLALVEELHAINNKLDTFISQEQSEGLHRLPTRERQSP